MENLKNIKIKKIKKIGKKTTVDFSLKPYEIYKLNGVYSHNCHNPEMQDYWYGVDWDIEDIVKHIKRNSDFIDGVTLSGGDPLFQLNNTTKLLKRLREEGIKDIWLYTGYYFEDIPGYIKSLVDVIIDGPYEQDKLAARWRGSDNQRVFRKFNGNFFLESPNKPMRWR